jgi:hypothetical protein
MHWLRLPRRFSVGSGDWSHVHEHGCCLRKRCSDERQLQTYLMPSRPLNRAFKSDIDRPRSQASITDEIVKRNVKKLRPHEQAFAFVELAAQ